MTKPSNIAAIEDTTGITWEDWVSYLDTQKARNLSHKEIADIVHEKIKEQESAGWWSQSVTVAYEQHIGRREPGQRSDGSYEMSVSKTFDGTMDEALEEWVHMTSDLTGFNGVSFEKEPTWSETEKWRNWRVALSDGSRVAVGIYQKSNDKASLGLGHMKLQNKEAADEWREFWKEFMKGF